VSYSRLSWIAAGIGAATALAAGSTTTWRFDDGPLNSPPRGFSFGLTARVGKPGRWAVELVKDAPSGGRALGQLDTDPTNARYPLAVADQPPLSDLRLSARCKLVSGKVDQACGLVFRYSDENNHYVTRANALEGNVRLYRVKDGKRSQFATWDGEVTANVWHTIAAEAKGDLLRVFWNGKNVIEAKDSTFTQPGKVGVWTKADSVTYFDDLTVTSL
jgi:hypothetical protein